MDTNYLLGELSIQLGFRPVPVQECLFLTKNKCTCACAVCVSGCPVALIAIACTGNQQRRCTNGPRAFPVRHLACGVPMVRQWPIC